jgi:peptidoglycan hydrolase-like amidase
MFKLLHLSTLAIFAYANLVVNGDFENSADVYCTKELCYLSDVGAIAPWKLSTGSQFELDGTVWPAKSGKWSMDLSAEEPYSISQDIPTVSGTKYVLTFYVNKNKVCDDADRTGEFQVGGQSKISFIHNKGLNEWFKITQYFTAASESTSLTFTGTGSGSCGAVIDNVGMELV